jgi:hypothetical protein
LDADAGFAAEDRLYELRSWAMQELIQYAFVAHVTAGEVVGLEEGAGWALAIVSAEAMPAEDVAVHLALLSGTSAEMLELASRIQRMAGESIRFRLPVAYSPADDDAGYAAAGFEARPWELHILSRPAASPLPTIDPQRLVLGDPPRRRMRPPA